MTSRPPLGVVQQRQPQRSLSGSSLSQRPGHQRNLSQQYLPSSPIRKESPLHDASGQESSEAPAQSRYGAQRRVGSRLKLELSHDAADSITQTSFIESPNPLDSSKSFTPTRSIPQSQSDTPELGGDLSPHPSRGRPTATARCPCPPRPGRLWAAQPSRASDQRKDPPSNAAKKDNRPKPWTVEIPPKAPVYKLAQGKSEPQGKASYGGALETCP